MVKKSITITMILLIFAMIVSLIIVLNKSSFAAEIDGPADNGVLYIGDYCLYSTQNPEYVVTIQNASYDIVTNTLTLNNFSGEYISAYNMGKDFSIKLIGENELNMDPEDYDETEILPAILIQNEGNDANTKIYGTNNSVDDRDSLRLSYNCGILVEGNLTVENCEITDCFVETFENLTVNNSRIYTGFIDCKKFVENGDDCSVSTNDALKVENSDGSVNYYGLYSRANSIKVNTGHLRISYLDDIYYVKSEVYGPGHYNGVYDEPYEFCPANTPIETENRLVRQEGDWNKIERGGAYFIVFTNERAKEYYKSFAVDIINIVKPVAGETPRVDTLEMVFPGLDEIYNDRCYWFDKDKPGIKVTKFEAGKTYGLYTEVYATMSNRFGESTSYENLDSIMFEEEFADEMGNLDEGTPMEFWAIKYYECEGENPPEEPEQNVIPETNETKTQENDLDKDVKDSSLEIKEKEKNANNPKTGDIVQKYLTIGVAGIIVATFVVRLRTKYGRKANKIQF